MKSEVTWGDMGSPSATGDARIQNNPTPHCKEMRLAKCLLSKEEYRRDYFRKSFIAIWLKT